MCICDNPEVGRTVVTIQRMIVQLLQCRGWLYICDNAEVGCTFVTMQRFNVHL